MEEDTVGGNTGVRVSVFDYSVENHFKAIDTISKLCEEPESDGLDSSYIQHLSSTITFLREWRYFNYKPRIIRFANETGGFGRKDILGEIKLPQFSSAAVPKEEELCANTTLEFSKDFVMNVGGSVWALDWCPRVHERSDCQARCEFIAVAAHPPESYYHKLGSPLTGRGIIQIWCILNAGVYEEEPLSSKKSLKRRTQNDEASDNKSKKPRGRPRKKPIDEAINDDATKDRSTQLKKLRGRPRKTPRDESTENLDGSDQFVQPLAVQHPEDSFELLTIQEISENTQQDIVRKNLNRKKKNLTKRASSSNSALKTLVEGRRLKSKACVEKYNDDKCQPLLTTNEDEGTPITNLQICHGSERDSVVCNNVSGNNPSNTNLASCSIPKELALPKVVLCLAHNGKVAWDVKWKPYNSNDCKCKNQMGYLAVLLGNGSLEVWEVPFLSTMKAIYLSSIKEGTDPRFVKLEPVFRCSMLKCGGIQSIPWTLEWSTSPPHDYLLAGCHDGTVAVWKFDVSSSSKDTRPLLCFSADTVAIRAVSWAPSESDPESANVILTAGHGGLKFWDIRDPFHPLWDLHPAPRFIYGLDWSRDPRCVILSFDDGAMRILSLAKAAYDVPATGKPFAGTKQQGLHLINCSPFAVWSVQVSRLTGMVAYCSADGTVLRFQLTTKAVEKDHSRYRPLHFPCGSLTEDKSTITVNTPLQDFPIKLKKSVNEGDRSMRSFLIESTPVKSSNDKKGKTVLNLDNQPLALCYSNDMVEELDVDETLEVIKSKKEPKFRSSSKKKAEDNRALVCMDEKQKGEASNGIDVLPSKLVALHRVRWNMNKGSERWLCYGGAAGIVRCQEI